jgi:hypothetical protein
MPNALSGKEVTLQPAMIEANYFSEDELQTTPGRFYDQFLNGNWVDPKLIGQLPNNLGGNSNPADFNYTGTEQHRLWQVWIDTPTASPVLEMEVKYPPGVLQRNDGRGYMFRLAMHRSTNEADRANTAFSGELKEKDGIVLTHKSTQQLKLAVPN